MQTIVLKAEENVRRARLFRNGRNQVVRIPREFEFSGDEVVLRREGRQLIVEPIGPSVGLLKVLENLLPLEDSFPDVDEGLLPLDNARI